MAARELSGFELWAQLLARPVFPARRPVESIPQLVLGQGRT
jgi:hypothetical protein